MLLAVLFGLILSVSTFVKTDNTYAWPVTRYSIAHCYDNYNWKGYDSGGVYNTEYFLFGGTDSTGDTRLPVTQYANLDNIILTAEDYCNVDVSESYSLPTNVSYNNDSRKLEDVFGYGDNETATVSTGRIIYRQKTGRYGSWGNWSITNLQNYGSTWEDLANFNGANKYIQITVIYELKERFWWGSKYYNMRADYCIYIAP